VIKVALRGLAGRKLRAALTGIAIVLGVAMISGTYILTDTIDRAFKNLFSETYAGTDVVVSGKGLDISFQGDTSESPPVDASLLGKIRALPGVEVAAGSVVDETSTKILTPEGKAINTEGAPSFGFGIVYAAEAFDLVLRDDRFVARLYVEQPQDGVGGGA